MTPTNKPWTPPPASVAQAHGSFTRDAERAKPPLSDHGRKGRLEPLRRACTSGQSGTKKLTAEGLHAIVAGAAWVTVITGTYPNGVIRGQITHS